VPAWQGCPGHAIKQSPKGCVSSPINFISSPAKHLPTGCSQAAVQPNGQRCVTKLLLNGLAYQFTDLRDGLALIQAGDNLF
jgi:hypothetical protein